MKIQIASDLHAEFGLPSRVYDALVEAPADVLILAGDIHGNEGIMGYLNHLQHDSGKTIIYVPGNHEYYGRRRSSFDEELLIMNSINKKVHVLIEGHICMGGAMFIGSTGWWDGSGGHIGLTVKSALNDFYQIYDILEGDNLDGIKWGRLAKCHFNKMLTKANQLGMLPICVSHHAPHPRSIAPQWQGNVLNGVFVNRWECLFEDHFPALWVHGHTHSSFNYTVSEDDPTKDYADLKKSQVICNPWGYTTIEENPNFDPNFVVDISDLKR